MSHDGAALQQALRLQRQPECLFELQQARLPEGMAELIRLASDGGRLRDSSAHALGIDSARLQQAAVAYLRGVCLFPGSAGPRVLGLNDARDMRLAKEHHRLLIKWLHPDRNQENHSLAERVNQAWSQLKSGLIDAPAVAAPYGEWMAAAEALPRRKSRFALFLAGLAALAAGLLLFSAMPGQEVYVTGVDSDAALGATEAGGTEEKSDGPLPSLRDLAWGGPEPQAKPKPEAAKPAKKAVVAVANVPAMKPVVAVIATNKQGQGPENGGMTGMRGPNGQMPSNNGARPAQGMAAPVPAPAIPVPHAAPMPARTVQAAVPAPETAAAGSLAAPKAPPSGGISVDDGRLGLQQFARLYRQGDITAFMALFSADARNNRGDRSAIAQDYGRLFEGSKRRELLLSAMQWRQVGDEVHLQARYQSKVQHEGSLVSLRNEGRMSLVFVEEKGQARIQRILIGQ